MARLDLEFDPMQIDPEYLKRSRKNTQAKRGGRAQ